MPNVEQRDVRAEGEVDSDRDRFFDRDHWNNTLESHQRKKRSRSESMSPSARTSRKLPQHRIVRHESTFPLRLTNHQPIERQSDHIPTDQNLSSFETNSGLSTSVEVQTHYTHSHTGTLRDKTSPESSSNTYQDTSKYKVETNQ